MTSLSLNVKSPRGALLERRSLLFLEEVLEFMLKSCAMGGEWSLGRSGLRAVSLDIVESTYERSV